MVYKVKYINDDLDDVFKTLGQRIITMGGTLIGSGAFANVYSHPLNSRTVLKMGYHNKKVWKKKHGAEDDGYLRFIKATKKTRSVFLPLISDVQVFAHQDDIRGDCIFVVTMERLQSHEIPQIGAERARQEATYAKMIHPSLEKISDLQCTYREILRDKTITPATKGLCTALAYTWTAQNKDLHFYNWMIRKTPRGPIPVITDPAK